MINFKYQKNLFRIVYKEPTELPTVFVQLSKTKSSIKICTKIQTCKKNFNPVFLLTNKVMTKYILA